MEIAVLEEAVKDKNFEIKSIEFDIKDLDIKIADLKKKREELA